MSKHNLPAEPGLYWASEYSMLEEWELIAKVFGTSPFLQCGVWRYFNGTISEFYHPSSLYFGPRITIPTRDPRARPLED